MIKRIYQNEIKRVEWLYFVTWIDWYHFTLRLYKFQKIQISTLEPSSKCIRKSLKSSSLVPLSLFKGDAGAGKSSLIQTYVKKNYQFSSDYGMVLYRLSLDARRINLL